MSANLLGFRIICLLALRAAIVGVFGLDPSDDNKCTSASSATQGQNFLAESAAMRWGWDLTAHVDFWRPIKNRDHFVWVEIEVGRGEKAAKWPAEARNKFYRVWREWFALRLNLFSRSYTLSPSLSCDKEATKGPLNLSQPKPRAATSSSHLRNVDDALSRTN